MSRHNARDSKVSLMEAEVAHGSHPLSPLAQQGHDLMEILLACCAVHQTNAMLRTPAPRKTQKSMNARRRELSVRLGLKRKSRASNSTKPV